MTRRHGEGTGARNLPARGDKPAADTFHPRTPSHLRPTSLSQVLTYLLSVARAPEGPDRGGGGGGGGGPGGPPSRAHVEAVHAKLLHGGLVQAVVSGTWARNR